MKLTWFKKDYEWDQHVFFFALATTPKHRFLRFIHNVDILSHESSTPSKSLENIIIKAHALVFFNSLITNDMMFVTITYWNKFAFTVLQFKVPIRYRICHEKPTECNALNIIDYWFTMAFCLATGKTENNFMYWLSSLLSVTSMIET